MKVEWVGNALSPIGPLLSITTWARQAHKLRIRPNKPVLLELSFSYNIANAQSNLFVLLTPKFLGFCRISLSLALVHSQSLQHEQIGPTTGSQEVISLSLFRSAIFSRVSL
jgi:hypothetical protein